MSRRTTQREDGPGRSSRRGMLRQPGRGRARRDSTREQASQPRFPSAERTVKNGRINQSIVYWCFESTWDMEQTAKVAKQLGCDSIELMAPASSCTSKIWAQVRDRHDRDGSRPAVRKGFNNPKYREKVLKATRDSIDACADFGTKNVICFTGIKASPTTSELTTASKGYKQIVGYAEKKGVTLCLEMLDSRVSSHPMKGHPGYQGDHTDYCIDIIKRVGSPNLKLLFDIYHVQIMDGDIISRNRQHRDYIAHVHTAGNPGRAELDDKQEISDKPIMAALLEIGYKGHVGRSYPDSGPAGRLAASCYALRCLIDGKAGGLATREPGWVVKSLACTKEVGPGRFC